MTLIIELKKEVVLDNLLTATFTLNLLITVIVAPFSLAFITKLA